MTNLIPVNKSISYNVISQQYANLSNSNDHLARKTNTKHANEEDKYNEPINIAGMKKASILRTTLFSTAGSISPASSLTMAQATSLSVGAVADAAIVCDSA